MCVLSNKEGKRERERKKRALHFYRQTKNFFSAKKCIFLAKKQIICE
jgi:hypothetical protein